MRWALGIRWWHSLAFAVVAAVTAVAVAQVVPLRSEDAFRNRAQELAAGNAFQAAIELTRAEENGRLASSLPRVADERRLALFVYDPDGRLLTPELSRNVRVETIRVREEAVASALGGRRFAATNDELRGTTVALPMHGGSAGALLAFAYHPDLAAGLGILRREVFVAALWAVLLGGAVGFLIASLIAARLGRIAHAAAAIEGGDLATPLRPGFPDEVGRLGATIERMRRRLQASFGQIASERDRVRQLVERLREGVVSVHADLTVDLANAEARRLLGAPRLRSGETLPDPWPAFALDAFVAGLFEPGAEVTETFVETAGDRTLAIAGLPPHRGSGSETAILVLADVSERERRERAEREFVANAAHELRTPLMTIVGAVEALQARSEGDPHQERFVGHIAREAGRLTRLTRALLVLARAQTRQESPRSEAVAAHELLEQVRDGIAPSDGVSVEVDCPPDLLLHTNRDLVEQALVNLVANAARHTAGGRIVLAARARGDRIELEVADTGEGIAESEQDRVFERFYRASERDGDGFGLGLSIVRQAVTALGGTIDFRSSPGSGTRVRIGMPAPGKEQA